MPRLAGIGAPGEKTVGLSAAVKLIIQRVGIVAVVLQPRIEVGAFRPNAVDDPEVGGAELVHVRRNGPLVGRRPMVLNAHQRRVPFRHRIASHPHLHPGQVLDAFGVVDGVHEVHAALVQAPVGVEGDERWLVDAGVVNHDLIVLATGDDFGVVPVPVGVPHGHIQRL